MCMPASLVVTKDRIFWSKFSESHEDIIEEFHLYADGVCGPNIVRVGLLPPYADYTKPVEEWLFRVDQDYLPHWWFQEKHEEEVREIVEHSWLPAKVVLPGEHRHAVKYQNLVAVYGTIDTIYDTRIEEMSGLAHIESVEGASYIARLRDEADIGSVNLYSIIGEMYDDSRIHGLFGYSQVFKLRDNSRIKWVGENARVDAATNRSQIDLVTDHVTVNYVTGKAKIGFVGGSATVKLYNKQHDITIADNAAVIDCTTRPHRMLSANI